MKKIYLPLLAFCGLFSTAAVNAQTTVNYVGANNGAWTQASNWSTNTVPTSNATVVIPVSTTVVVTGSVSLTNSTINVKGTLQVGNGSGNGANKGVVTMDATSSILVQNNAHITSVDASNSSNQIIIGNGANKVKFQGGQGTINGPVMADASTSGFVAATLPVVLLGFNANLNNDNKVNIQWSTQQEVSTDHFDIQRSSDGISWKTIATVQASGYSAIQRNYSLQDDAPQSGTNLYRMRMVDFDAKFGFSSVVNVRLNLLGKVSVYPNPSVSNVQISLGHAPSNDWTVSLINQIGQTVLLQKYSRTITTITLPVGNLPNGNYSVSIADGSNQQVSKLMIAHQ